MKPFATTREAMQAFVLYGELGQFARRCRRGRWWLKVPKHFRLAVGLEGDPARTSPHDYTNADSEDLASAFLERLTGEQLESWQKQVLDGVARRDLVRISPLEIRLTAADEQFVEEMRRCREQVTRGLAVPQEGF